MVSRDLVPMRERIAGPRGSGKPLQIAVDGRTGHNGGCAASTVPGFKPPPRGGGVKNDANGPNTHRSRWSHVRVSRDREHGFQRIMSNDFRGS